MQRRERGEGRTVWRAPLGYRVVFPLFGAFFLWVGLSPWEDSEGFWSDLPTACSAPPWPWRSWPCLSVRVSSSCPIGSLLADWSRGGSSRFPS